MMYKTKINENGQIELWHEGENTLYLLGVYDSQEELDEARARIQKQEERAQFQSHTLKDGKRSRVVLRDPDLGESESSTIKALIISDDILQVGALEGQKIDLLISLGDLPDYTLVRASEVYQPIQFLAVRGNHDDLKPFPKPIQDLHLQMTEFRGITFAGFSGSWNYKEGGDYLFSQERAGRLLNRFPKVDVFIAHNSPWGVHERDKDIHQGFKVFQEYIERVQPRYFLHGHQHVNQVTWVGNTEVVGVYGEKMVEIDVSPEI